MTNAAAQPSPAREQSARQQPWAALLLCFGYRWFGAYLLALPVAGAASQVVGEHPRADAVLWDAGGIWLGAFVRQGAPHIAAAMPLLNALALVWLFGWLVPNGALVHGLGTRRRVSLFVSLAASVRQLPRLIFAFGVTSLLSALLLVCTYALGRWVTLLAPSLALSALNQRAASLSWLVAMVSAMPLLLLLRMWQDALRLSALQNNPETIYAWLAHGFSLMRRAGPRGLGAMAARELAGAAALVLCGVAAWQISLQGGSALASAPLHLAGLACWLLLRFDWLRYLSAKNRLRSASKMRLQTGEVGALPNE